MVRKVSGYQGSEAGFRVFVRGCNSVEMVILMGVMGMVASHMKNSGTICSMTYHWSWGYCWHLLTNACQFLPIKILGWRMCPTKHGCGHFESEQETSRLAIPFETRRKRWSPKKIFISYATYPMSISQNVSKSWILFPYLGFSTETIHPTISMENVGIPWFKCWYIPSGKLT